MQIKIYSQSGTLKATVSPDSGSRCVKELQGDSVLSLSFDYFEYVALDVNDYVDFCGDRYWLLEQYRPKEVSSVEWKYDVSFYGIESLIKRYLVIEHTDGDANPVFTLTAPASQHVRMIVECLNNATGSQEWHVGNVVSTGNVAIDYTGKYCDEGLRELAEKAGAEYWFSGKTVNLCKCERGDQLEMAYGDGLISLERDVADNAKFYTRLYPVGSTRNIDPSVYGSKRLHLPNGAKYVDLEVEKYGVVDHYEQDAFSDIYPKYTGRISSVRVETRTDEDGEDFQVYFFKDENLPFNPNSYLLPGEPIHVSFQSGELQGMGEGDDHYFEADYNSETGEFEIVNLWTDGQQLPGGNLVPAVRDKYIPWNIGMPSEYYVYAEQALKAAVDNYNSSHFADNSVYRGTTDHVWIEADPDNDRDETELYIGLRIRLNSTEFFPGTGYRDSRITKISRRLDLPSLMEIEISDLPSLSSREKLEDGIKQASSGNYFEPTGSGGIRLKDNITEIENVYSKKESDERYLKVSFFRRLFQAYNSETPIAPNSTNSPITDVESKVGLWTESFLSALGRGGTQDSSTLLLEPLASINEAGLGTPSAAGVGIVWDGQHWTYGSTGNGFNNISKVSDGILRFTGAGGLSQQLDLRHTHVWSDITGRPTNLSQFNNDVPFASAASVAAATGSLSFFNAIQRVSDGVLRFTGQNATQNVDLVHSHPFSDITSKPNTLAGYGITDAYTMTQVDAKLATKVDCDWFRNLFRAYNGSTEVVPNQSGTVDNIKSMFGFWTNQYLSALGRGNTGGTMLDEALMWSLLGNNDATKQISIAHLTTALSSYASVTNALADVQRGSSDGILNFVKGGNGGTIVVDLRHTHVWGDITGRPTKLSQFQNDVPYATTADVATATGSLSFFNAIQRVSDGVLRFTGQNATQNVDLVHSHPFSDITSKPNTLAGYGITDAYTMTQVDAKLATKVDCDWFRNLFRAYNGSTEVVPNQSGIVDNIKSMFGFWTNQYLSALGRGNTGSTMLDEALMWSLLGNNDATKQISIAHLTTALSSYASVTNALADVQRGSSDGILNFVKGGNGGTIVVDLRHTHVWGDITGRPTKLSQFQNDVPYALQSHTHNVYLGTTQLTTGNAAGSVTNIAGLASINSNALVLRQITYNSASVNAVGIGTTPTYPLDVAGMARFSGGVYVYNASGSVSINISGSGMTFGGSGYVTQYLRKASSYLSLSSNNSGEVGLLVYQNNAVRFTAGAWSDTYLSALGQNTSSDRRLKMEICPIELKVEDIARAPMVRYLWVHNPRLGDQVGSYAQDWQKILPEAVKTGHDGYLEMQYGVIALLSAIATARKVVDHEERILKLEKENRQLKQKLSSIRRYGIQ